MAISLEEKIKGALLGAAVGDALGVPAEFMTRRQLAKNPVTGLRGGGYHGQPAGTWSDDTSLTLCAAQSLLEKGVDHADMMERFADWLWNASNTAHGEVFDVGGATRQAIFRFAQGVPATECGDDAEYSCGNGSLMRILPTALYAAAKYGASPNFLTDKTAEIIHDSSRCTHAHPRCLAACGIYGAVAAALCFGDGGDPQGTVPESVRAALGYYAKKPAFAGVLADFDGLDRIREREESTVSGSGYVLFTLEAALWCLLTTDSYAECVLRAISLGEDTDTTATVAGGLAGLLYGADGIPREWLDGLAKADELADLAERFAGRCAALRA